MITVADLSRIYSLTPQKCREHIEYIGPNPWEDGATDDGFSLIEGGKWHGTAYDRKLQRRYRSVDVARLAKIEYHAYEPSRLHPGGLAEHNGHTNGYTDSTMPQPQPEQKPELPPPGDIVPFAPKIKQFDTRSLPERGVRATTVSHFRVQIHADEGAPRSFGPHWSYPTFFEDGREGRWRSKFRFPERQLLIGRKKPVKCLWAIKGKDKGEPLGYNLNGVANCPDVWLVNSELGVWLWWQEGIPAICPLSEGRRIETYVKIFEILKGMGTVRICIMLDSDEAGKRGALNAYDAAVTVGLRAAVFDLTAYDRESMDASDLHDLYRDNKFQIEEGVNPPFKEVIWSQMQADVNKLEVWREGLKLLEKSKSAVESEMARSAPYQPKLEPPAQTPAPVAAPASETVPEPAQAPYYDKMGRTIAKIVRICPDCKKQAIIPNRFKGGWICYRRMGGCGAGFAPGFEEIENQDVEALKIPDIAVAQAAEKGGKDRAASSREKEDRASELLALVRGHQMFYTADGEFIVVEQSGQRVTHKIDSDGFILWCRYLYLQAKSVTLSSENIGQVVQSLRALCRIEGDEMQSYVRTASYGGRIYIDLCNKEFEVVQISEAGWRITKEYPVFFRRPEGMKEIPRPEVDQDGIAAPHDNQKTWYEFRKLLNLGDEKNFALIISWLFFALVPPKSNVDCPILSVHGQQGSAKTTLCRIVRETIDPNAGFMVTYVREERDVVTAAENARVFCLDNQTSIAPWLNSLLAAMVTGAPHRCRQLYKDDGSERFFVGQPALIINGIPPVIGELDLNDRAIKLNLPSLEDNYKSKSKIMQDWEDMRPALFTAILDAMVVGLRNQDAAAAFLADKRLPRMTDYMIWSVACEGKFEGAPVPGEFPVLSKNFYDIYWSNIAETARDSLDDIFIQSILLLVERKGRFVGLASQLYAQLIDLAAETLMDMEVYNSLDDARDGFEKQRMRSEARRHLESSRSFPVGAVAAGIKMKKIAGTMLRNGMAIYSEATRKGTIWTILPKGEKLDNYARMTLSDPCAPDANADLWEEEAQGEVPEVRADDENNEGEENTLELPLQ